MRRRLPLLALALLLGVPAATGRGADAVPAAPESSCSVLRFIPAALHAGIRDGTNTTPLDAYIQAALDHLNRVPADARAVAKAHTGGTLCFPAGDYLITTELGSDGDGVVLTGDGIATRLLLRDAGALRFGALDPDDPKRGPAAHNPKHVALRDLGIVALPGHRAGALVRVPISHHFVLEGVRISSAEPTNPVTGLYLSAFQYVEVRDATIAVNAYPIHLKALAAAPHYEAHVHISGSQLVLRGEVGRGGGAALYVEMERGATDPIRDFLVERTLLTAFTRDRGERGTVGLKITNPNRSMALSGTFTAAMFEQTEVLVDAATDAPQDRSHLNFIGVDFLGKRGVTAAAWKGNAHRSRPYFEGCMFTNMADAIDQPDPTVGPANNAVGITGAVFRDVAAVRYNGIERPFRSLPPFRAGGTARVADGGTIRHGLIGAPTRVQLTSGDADHAVSVAGTDAEGITVRVRRLDGTPDTRTPVTVYWEAAL